MQIHGDTTVELRDEDHRELVALLTMDETGATESLEAWLAERPWFRVGARVAAFATWA